LKKQACRGCPAHCRQRHLPAIARNSGKLATVTESKTVRLKTASGIVAAKIRGLENFVNHYSVTVPAADGPGYGGPAINCSTASDSRSAPVGEF
jgi:hypothetical protein